LHMCRHPITVKEKVDIQNYTYFKLQLILGSHHFDHIKWLMSNIHYINCQNPLNKACIYVKFYTQWIVTLILHTVQSCSKTGLSCAIKLLHCIILINFLFSSAWLE
jgi:hypothetical protein